MRPPAFKRFIFETQFEGPLLPCETEQVPYLCHFSSDQDEIWCVETTWVALDLYQISSRSAKNWPRYATLLFILQIAHSQKRKYHFFGHFSSEFSILGNKPEFFSWVVRWMVGGPNGTGLTPQKISNFWRKNAQTFGVFWWYELGPRILLYFWQVL